MTPAKRGFDIILALVMGALLFPLIAGIVLVILWRDGAPALYFTERILAPGRPFRMLKFRTMTPLSADTGVTGGEKALRITVTGRFLRRTHLDELPQLWNVLRGDMSLVGPRPPLRRYVEAYPALYARVLRARPGVTGLASLYCAAREARLLSRCASAAETEAVYRRDCIPVKARLDLIYQRHWWLGWDAWLLIATLCPPLRRIRWRRGRRSGPGVARAVPLSAPRRPSISRGAPRERHWAPTENHAGQARESPEQ